MTPQHKRIALLLGAAGLLAAGLARCVHGEHGGASTTPSSLGVASADAGVVAATPTPALVTAVADADAGASTDPAPPPADASVQAPARDPVGAYLASTTPVDREFLADVERLSKRTPPPAAGELIKMQHAGASRADLSRFIDQSFGNDVAVRTPALRWLEQVMPSGKSTAPAVPDMSSHKPGRVQTPTRP